MIPRSIFQIWVGENMPMAYREWCARMKRMNPDFEYRLWRNDILDHYADDPFVAWMIATNERSAFLVDRLRVLLLRDFGGIYCDADCYAVRPFRMLDDLWNNPQVEFVAGMRSPDRPHVSLSAPGVAFVDNTVLASSKGGVMANRLCALYRSNSRRHTGLSMGREVMRNADPSTVLLGWEFFYAETETPKTILLHDAINAASWLKPNKKDASIPRS